MFCWSQRTDLKKANSFHEMRPGMLWKCIIFYWHKRLVLGWEVTENALVLHPRDSALGRQMGSLRWKAEWDQQAEAAGCESAVDAVMPGQNHRELAKEGGAASQRRPSPAWHLWPSLFRREKLILFHDGLEFFRTHSLRSIRGVLEQGSGSQLMLC